MSWIRTRLKYVTAFAYGDALPADNSGDGDFLVFGSNGPFTRFNNTNTQSPAIIIGRKGSYGKINWSSESCFASDTTFFVDKSTTKNDLRWLYYLLQSLDLDRGSNETAVPGLNRENAYNKYVVIPPLSEQQAIANYLDNETTHINKLIIEKEKLLELLTEKRRTLIKNAVTQGLDSNVKLKDSGIDWIRAIPAHWKTAGFTKYLRSLVDYRGKTPEKSSDGIFLVTARNIKSGKINYEISKEYILPELYEESMSRGKPKKGDLLLTTEAPLGQVALIDREDIALAQRIIKLDYEPDVLLNQYVMYWIMSDIFQWHINTYSSGSTASGIKAERLHLLRNLIPPIPDQLAIIKFLKEKLLLFENTINATNSSINILHERRSALVAETVTGKLKVI